MIIQVMLLLAFLGLGVVLYIGWWVALTVTIIVVGIIIFINVLKAITTGGRQHSYE